MISNEINIEEMEDPGKRIQMAIEEAIYTVNGLESNFTPLVAPASCRCSRRGRDACATRKNSFFKRNAPDEAAT